MTVFVVPDNVRTLVTIWAGLVTVAVKVETIVLAGSRVVTVEVGPGTVVVRIIVCGCWVSVLNCVLVVTETCVMVCITVLVTGTV